MATKEDGKVRQAATETKQDTIISNQTTIENNQTTIQNNQTQIQANQVQIQNNQTDIEALAERIANARRTIRYYTVEVNSQSMAGNCMSQAFPAVVLPEGHTVHRAWLILEGCLVDTSGAANHFTGGTIQIMRTGQAFWGATPVTRCPYEIQANGVVAIKLVAQVGPPDGMVPPTEANSTYTARVTGATSTGGGGTLRFNGHWILEICYSV